MWLLPNASCDFGAAGAAQLGRGQAPPLTFPLPRAGTFHFGCSFPGHCEAGMLLTVEVGGEGEAHPRDCKGLLCTCTQGSIWLIGGQPARAPPPLPPAPPPAGSPAVELLPSAPSAAPSPPHTAAPAVPSHCEDPCPLADDEGAVTVTCYSQAVPLAPGDVSPYPCRSPALSEKGRWAATMHPASSRGAGLSCCIEGLPAGWPLLLKAAEFAPREALSAVRPQNLYPNVILASPYPANASVALLGVTAQVVDAQHQPVPLSEASAGRAFGAEGLLGQGQACAGARGGVATLPPCGEASQLQWHASCGQGRASAAFRALKA